MQKLILKDLIGRLFDQDDQPLKNPAESEHVTNIEGFSHYLESRCFVSGTTTLQPCSICENDFAGPRTYYTDGEWIWGKWMVHYVLKHDLMLPIEFIEFVEKKNFKIDNKAVDELLERSEIWTDLELNNENK